MERREFIAGAAGALLVGCSLSSSRGPGQRGKIIVSLNSATSMASALAAQELGYFDRAGLKLEMIRWTDMSQAIPTLAAGKVDVAFGGIKSAIINAVSRGLRLRVVAGREYENPSCGDEHSLLVNKNSFGGRIPKIEELKGRRIALSKQGTAEFAAEVICRKHGFSLRDMEEVNLRTSEAMFALAEGKVDVAIGIDMARTLMASSANIVPLIRLSDIMPYYQFSFILFGRRLLDGSVEQGARFLAAYLKGAQKYLDGFTPKELRKVAELRGMDPGRLDDLCRNTFPADLSVSEESIQRYIDFCYEKGRVRERIKAADLCDHRFLERAHQMVKDDTWQLPSD